MKACVLHAIKDLEYKEVPDPVVKKGEVLVQVKACGICSSDLDRVFRTGAYHFPIVLGHELAGQVVGINASSVAETTLTLESGVEIAFGKAEDIRDKERVIQQIIADNPYGVAYINVRMVESPTWRAI